MDNVVFEYLKDPFLARLATDIQKAGKIKAALIDATDKCNLRCKGCYYFSDDLDDFKTPENEDNFDALIESEKARGTNYITVVGGEPTLALHRVKKVYDNFHVAVVTNGLIKIPYEGFEKMFIGVSVWGDHETDTRLRGGGKINVFKKALENYKNDNRVIWYYTNMTGTANEIESVIDQIVENGNYVALNFYGDIEGLGGKFDHQQGFQETYDELNRMILKYPDRIFNTAYVNKMVITGKLYDETWGYHVCGSFTFDNELNEERIKNGKPYNKHFRAYNPDFKTTRRCCTGNTRDCSNCYDLWAHISWMMLNSKKHLGSKQEFTNWLTTTYSFYLANRFIDFEEGVKMLPEIHERACKPIIEEEKKVLAPLSSV